VRRSLPEKGMEATGSAEPKVGKETAANRNPLQNLGQGSGLAGEMMPIRHIRKSQ
jgi:hypothetical protein